MSQTDLTTAELAECLKYDARTIRDRLKDSVLLEGVQRWTTRAAPGWMTSVRSGRPRPLS